MRKLITCRPADLVRSELETLESEMSQCKEQPEDVLTYALFPQVATDFFKYRDAQQTKVDRNRGRHREWSISGLIRITDCR